MIWIMAHGPSFDYSRPPFDPMFARELLGQYVRMGITHEDQRPEVKRHEQFHGTVISKGSATPDFTTQWTVTLPDA